MATKEQLLRATRDNINDYKQTVNAILAFAAFVVHDGTSQRPNSQFGFGRRMNKSKDNSNSPSTEIFPDLVAQKTKQYGIVAEAKKTLDQNLSYWIQHVDQLRKYDDNLEGWWTKDEKIINSDAVMLIHQSRGRLFRDFLDKCKKKDPDSVGQNTSIIEFNESPETEPYYFFRMEYGQIRDDKLRKSLYEGRQIPLEKVKMSFSSIQYYDAKPPLPMILMRLWTDYFPSKLDESEYDEQTKAMKIMVNISEVTDELQKAFGSQALHRDDRSSEFPKKRWLREALDQLVAYKLASHNSNNDEYTIFFKSFRGDVLERFIQYEIKKGKDKKMEPSMKQLTFF